jgi:hypothetical protein
MTTTTKFMKFCYCFFDITAIFHIFNITSDFHMFIDLLCQHLSRVTMSENQPLHLSRVTMERHPLCLTK